MTQPNITLREITEDTVNDILALEVAAHQKGFVATNAKSIAQAHFCENAWFRAIYADDTPVGFVMLYIDTEKPEYFLWRFMIDEKYQKKDYGLRAMELVIQFVRTFPNATRLELSYAPGEGDPSGFYARLGFLETGEWLNKQKVMRLTL
ncbi:MAG: GNAT family N-acetyltransferase [Candidatus Zixiibacteriota bacterium]|nr:MAG: GNAT family N-acetyltransferase [candidate division Zixibacteria bacterium]